MITVETTDTDIRVTIPKSEIPAEGLESFLKWLSLEAIVARGQLTEETATRLADEIKTIWWSANKERFIPPAS